MRPLATICGTGVVKGSMARTAYWLHRLEGRAEPFAIPELGLGGIDPTHHPLADEIEAWVAGQEGPIVIFAHSQGTLHALMFALDHPDKVCGLVLLCGPLDGTWLIGMIPTPIKHLLRHLAPSVLDMEPHSPMLEQLHQRIAREWPRHIAVRLITGECDFLVSHQSAITAEFPDGTDVSRYYFGTHLPRHGIPDGMDINLVLTPPPFSGHLALMFHPLVSTIIRNLRRHATTELAQAS